ncbi:MAG: FAD-dependent oxidoreductase [Candidatus Dormibacteraeota bacterium]|nr:FAD-dependent oxidoreductase [Candidatus Dormibacteraeota bacterium]
MRIIVVGGGIVGASAAYEVACRGASVILVDREDQGYATQAGAGIVSGVSIREHRPAFAAIVHPAIARYPELVARLAEDGVAESGYSQAHGLVVAQPDEQAALREAFARVVEEWSGDPHRVGSFELLAAGEAQRLFPGIDERLSAIHLRNSARVDGRVFRAGLLRALGHRGGEVVKGGAALIIEGGRARGVRVGGSRLEADAVILCTGAWAPELLRELLPNLGVAPQRGQIIHLAIPDRDTGDWPFIVGYHSHYLLPFADRVVVGATRETGSGFDYRFTARGVSEVLSEALRIAPGLGPATVREMRIGFRPLSDDLLPFLGPVPGVEGLVLATGTGPSGLTIGPFCGAVAAGLALGEPALLDLSAYSPARVVAVD